MALENVEYTKRGTIDWAGLTNKIAEGVNQIGVDQKKAREENEAAFDQANTLLNKPMNLEKQSLNTFVIDSSESARQQLLDAKRKLYNREITSAEYKKIASNLQEHWSNFAEQVKTADDRFKLYQERNTPDANGVIAASDAENFLMEQYLQAADLNNKKMVIGKDGTMYLQQVDPQTGQPTGELIDYRDFARPENMQINRINLPTAVENITGNWAVFQEWVDKGRGGELNIESVRKQPGYNQAKINAVNAVVNNPKAALSVLVDNGIPGGGMYYTKDSDGEQMIAKKIAEQEAINGGPLTEDQKKMIRMSAVKWIKNAAGEFVPELTEEQMVFAKEIVDREIDMQMEYKMSGTPRQQWAQTYGPNAGGGGTNGAANYSTYAKIRNSWKTGDMNALNNMNDDYIFKWDSKKGKVNVYKKQMVTPKKKGDPNYVQGDFVGAASEALELSRYFYKGTGKVTPEQMFENERQAYLVDNPENSGGGELD